MTRRFKRRHTQVLNSDDFKSCSIEIKGKSLEPSLLFSNSLISSNFKTIKQNFTNKVS